MARSALTELSELPQKVSDPNWLSTVDDDGQEPIRPASGQEIRAEQAKAKKRRKHKTQTMRELRAKGKIA
jgi:hypothetical protein